jgi:hypothetical protein
MGTFATKQPAKEDSKQRLVAAQSTANRLGRNFSSLSTGAVLLQRKPTCACGGGCPRCQAERDMEEMLPIQAKIEMSQPGDQYEQEADRVAKQIMQMPNLDLQPQVDKEERKELLQSKLQVQQRISGGGNYMEAPPIVHEVLQSPGHPLDPSTRQFMEIRFGHDFSQVRVHTDAKASESAKSIHASAYTLASNLVFADGQYSPHTSTGRWLLAHELAHVVQQSKTSVAPRLQRRVEGVKFGPGVRPFDQGGLIGMQIDIHFLSDAWTPTDRGIYQEQVSAPQDLTGSFEVNPPPLPTVDEYFSHRFDKPDRHAYSKSDLIRQVRSHGLGSFKLYQLFLFQDPGFFGGYSSTYVIPYSGYEIYHSLEIPGEIPGLEPNECFSELLTESELDSVVFTTCKAPFPCTINGHSANEGREDRETPNLTYCLSVPLVGSMNTARSEPDINDTCIQRYVSPEPERLFVPHIENTQLSIQRRLDVRGSGDQQSTINSDLNTLRNQSSTARELIQYFNNNRWRDTVVIEPASGGCGTIKVHNIYISYNCQRCPISPSDSSWENSSVPNAIYLAHELIHAYNRIQSDQLPPEPTREWMTVGLGRHSGLEYTENRIRCEMGLPLRTFYYINDPERYHRQGYGDPQCVGSTYSHPRSQLQISTSPIQISRAPNQNHPIRWRLARSGEYFHTLKSGWDDTNHAQQLERTFPDNRYFLIREVMVEPDILKMRQLGGIEIIFHYVNHIENVQGSRVLRSSACGQTLRNREEPRVPRDQVHIAITPENSPELEKLDSPERFRRILLHELFHGFIATPIPRSRQSPEGRVSSPGRGSPLHPTDLVNALYYPQHGLARMLHWPSTWNHSYRFGWFEHPVSHIWRNLDNPILYNRLNRESLEECINTTSIDSVRNTCSELLRIKRERLYERGLRVSENPEEDMAESFELYLGSERFFASHPRRSELLSLYLHTER